MPFLKRLSLLLISTLILLYVTYFTEPPKSWEQSTTFQILVFFIPLLLSFTFLINLFLNYLPKSFALGLGLMILVVLKTTDIFNIFTAFATILLTIILFKFVKRPSLTKNIKIRKLTHMH